MKRLLRIYAPTSTGDCCDYAVLVRLGNEVPLVWPRRSQAGNDVAFCMLVRLEKQMTDETFVEDLRRALPPIMRNPYSLALAQLGDRVTLDCEWDKKTGELTLIGIGNRKAICQFWWKELEPDRRAEIGADIRALARSGTVFVYQNADADIRKMRQHGIPITVEDHRRFEDTMLAHAVLHSEEEHSLEYLVANRGSLPPYAHLLDSHPDVKNACDIISTLAVWDTLLPELAADPAAERVYREERLPMLPYLIHDEERGIPVNTALIYPLRDKFDQRRQQATKLVHSDCGYFVNLNSPDQMKTLIYGIKGFPVQYDKDTKKPTLDKDALATLRRLVFTEWDADEEPTLEQARANIAAGGDAALEGRYLYLGAQQAISHYVDYCLEWDGDTILGVKDRIYPETRQHVQTSGRQSIVGPAMQQLKGELEKLVWPRPGFRWLGWDWSNIETWILGELAGDPLIREAKAKGWDTHTINYCDITGTPYPPILTKALHTAPECAAWRDALRWQGEEDQRRVFAKRYVYRLHYRGQPESAGDIPGARALNFDGPRLVEASERYLGKHHWIVEWWKKIEYEVDHFGVVYAFMGMPRRLTSPYKNARYREACNHPMQAGVAHIYNTTRLLIHQALTWLEFMYGKHDSQLWESPENRVEEAWLFIKGIVQRAFIINGQSVNFPASFKERIA